MSTTVSSVDLEGLPLKCSDTTLLVVVVATDVLCCELRGEAVILNLKSGVYYGLDSIGARIWELIKEPIAIGDVCAVLLEEYNVSREQCEMEVRSLFQQLAELGLVELRNEVAA